MGKTDTPVDEQQFKTTTESPFEENVYDQASGTFVHKQWGYRSLHEPRPLSNWRSVMGRAVGGFQRMFRAPKKEPKPGQHGDYLHLGAHGSAQREKELQAFKKWQEENPDKNTRLARKKTRKSSRKKIARPARWRR